MEGIGQVIALDNDKGYCRTSYSMIEIYFCGVVNIHNDLYLFLIIFFKEKKKKKALHLIYPLALLIKIYTHPVM